MNKEKSLISKRIILVIFLFICLIVGSTTQFSFQIGGKDVVFDAVSSKYGVLNYYWLDILCGKSDIVTSPEDIDYMYFYNEGNATDFYYNNSESSSYERFNIGSSNTSGYVVWSSSVTDYYEVYAEIYESSTTGETTIIFSSNGDASIVLPETSISIFSTTQRFDEQNLYLSNLKELNLENCYLTNITTNISYMFINCTSLTSLTLTNFDTTGVTSMDYIFANCSSITSLDISSFTMISGNVSTPTHMFSGMTSLSIIKTPKLANLRGIALPNTFVNEQFGEFTTLPDCQDLNCNSLILTKKEQYAVLKNTWLRDIIDTVLDNKDVFLEDNGVQLYSPEDVVEIWFFDDETKLSQNFTNLFSGYEEIPVGAGDDEGVTDWTSSSGYAELTAYVSGWTWKDPNTMTDAVSIIAFYSPSGNIALPTDSSYLFSSMPNLLNVDLTGINNGYCNITNTSYMFYNCRSLESVKGSENLRLVDTESMEYMFSGCESLISIDLSSAETENCLDFSYMFKDCSSLENIILGQRFIAYYAENITGMFKNCSSIEVLDLTYFDLGQIYGYDDVFYGMTALKEILTPGVWCSPLTLPGIYQYSGDECYYTEVCDFTEMGESLTRVGIPIDYTWSNNLEQEVYEYSYSLVFTDIPYTGNDSYQYIENVGSVSGAIPIEMWAVEETDGLKIIIYCPEPICLTDGSSMFQHMNLTQIDFSNFNTVTATSMKNMLSGNDIEVLDLNDFYMPLNVDTENMLYGLDCLKTIVAPHGFGGNFTMELPYGMYNTKDKVIYYSILESDINKVYKTGHVITANSNGGTLTNSEDNSWIVTNETTATKIVLWGETIESFPVANKEGEFKLNYWNTSSSGDGDIYIENSFVTQEMVLYAIYTIKDYSIKFYATEEALYCEENKYRNSSYIAPIKPEKDGFVFEGWSTSADTTVEWSTGSQTCNGEMSWYAVWSRNYVINVYYINNNQVAKQTINQLVYTKFDNTEKMASVEIPEIAVKSFNDNGIYNFIGYTIDKSSLIPTYANANDVISKQTSISTEDSVNLYAIYRKDIIITVHSNNSKLEQEEYRNRAFKLATEVDITESINKTAITTTFQAENCTFLGWALSEDSQHISYENNVEYAFDKDINLFAVWEDNNEYTYSVEYWLQDSETKEFVKENSLTKTQSEKAGVYILASQFQINLENYIFESIAYSNSSVENSSLELAVCKDNSLVIKLYYNAVTYTINVEIVNNDNEVGNVSFTSQENVMIATVLPNQNITLYINYGDGYKLKSITSLNENVTIETIEDKKASSVEISNIMGNDTIYVEFEKETFSIDLTKSHQSISTETVTVNDIVTIETTFEYGTEILITTNMNDYSYKVKGWKINGSYLLNQDNSLYIEKTLTLTITQNISILIEFENEEQIFWSSKTIRANQFTSGTGTKDDPFMITSANELGLLSYLVNNDLTINGIKASQGYYILMKNIDMSKYNWIRVASETLGYEFTGNFDYNNNSVTNVKQYYNEKIYQDDIIGVLNNGVVLNKPHNVNIATIIITVVVVILVAAVTVTILLIRKKKQEKNRPKPFILPPSGEYNRANMFDVFNKNKR